MVPNELIKVVVGGAPGLPALFTLSEAAARRYVEFFTATIRNANTRKLYLRAASEFSAWCETMGLRDLQHVEPVHVATYIEQLQLRLAAPTVKVHLAALRMLFDWLVTGQVMKSNPASSVRGPKYSAKKGKTPVLTAEETRQLLDSIDVSTLAGLRDRALIGMMVYTFARIGAVVKMRGRDVYVQSRRTWVRLQEKGGKQHVMPCHHILESYIHAYIDAAGITAEDKGILFRTNPGHGDKLTDAPLGQSNAYEMVRKRALAAGIATKIGNHSFRATGITEYLRNGGKLEIAQQMANHESARTTGLYDRRSDQVSIDEIERILI